MRTLPVLALAFAVALVGGACTPDGATPVPDATSAHGPASAGPVAVASVPATPTPTPTPTPTSAPVAEADLEPFAMNLAERDDFVAQYTFEWCVGASLQMAVNIATDERRTSRADQERLWELARDLSSSPFGGANPRGWTAALDELGVGPYRLVSLPTMEEALVVAAEAIRATDRPVGLVMWRGRHAWVMSGFESTADPRTSDAFEVTGIRVHDPLYPHGSNVWGRSPRPNTLVSPETLGQQFVLRDSTRVNLGVGPGYLLVLPINQEA
ncbi:MAG: hypothetical protein WEG56_05025 [Chloroflexota bacterium]